jgi:hypothetical protein
MRSAPCFVAMLLALACPACATGGEAGLGGTHHGGDAAGVDATLTDDAGEGDATSAAPHDATSAHEASGSTSDGATGEGDGSSLEVGADTSPTSEDALDDVSTTDASGTTDAVTAPTDSGSSVTDTGTVVDAGCCAHPTTSTGAKLSRDCGTCISAICFVNAACCDTEWDLTCVAAASLAKCACK